MTEQQISLGMYASAVSIAVFADLGEYLRAGLADVPGKLVLGQICGIEFAHAAPGQYHYIGSFSLPGFAPGYYNSVLITAAEGGLEHLDDFDPAQHIAAINEPGSFSGSIAFAAHMLGHGKALFPNLLMTGGHLNSIAAVARGDAVLAAIDRLSFNLGRHANPEAWQGVKIIGETKPRPGLPFICDAAVPDDQLAVMQERFLQASAQPFWAEIARLLGASGTDRIKAEKFAAMRDV